MIVIEMSSLGIFYEHIWPCKHMVRASPKTLEGTRASEGHWNLTTISSWKEQSLFFKDGGTCGNCRKREFLQKGRCREDKMTDDHHTLTPPAVTCSCGFLKNMFYTAPDLWPQIPRWFSILMSYTRLQGGYTDLSGPDQSKPSWPAPSFFP